MEEECKKGRLQAVTAQRDKGSARRQEQSTIKFMHLCCAYILYSNIHGEQRVYGNAVRLPRIWESKSVGERCLSPTYMGNEECRVHYNLFPHTYQWETNCYNVLIHSLFPIIIILGDQIVLYTPTVFVPIHNDNYVISVPTVFVPHT